MINNDIFHLVNDIAGQNAPAIASVSILLVIIIFLNRGKIRHIWLNFKTRYCLNRLGFKQKTNFQWPDGLGHYFTIDRLILRHDGISLLVHKRYPGKIFCADKMDDWTQMLGKKSYRFKNPLNDLDCLINTVSACIPGVPVDGFLFFDHMAEFPKGHPERVIYLNKIPEELLVDKKLEVQASVMSAWQQLQSMSQG